MRENKDFMGALKKEGIGPFAKKEDVNIKGDKKVRTFATGATRDTAEEKPDYAGYLSPLVIKRFGLYMLRHQKQADGSMRESDNWQKGMPLNVYMSSMFRHFMDVWVADRKLDLAVDKEEALCALLFNAMGYLHELLKEGREDIGENCYGDTVHYGLGIPTLFKKRNKTPYEENTGREDYTGEETRLYRDSHPHSEWYGLKPEERS